MFIVKVVCGNFCVVYKKSTPLSCQFPSSNEYTKFHIIDMILASSVHNLHFIHFQLFSAHSQLPYNIPKPHYPEKTIMTTPQSRTSSQKIAFEMPPKSHHRQELFPGSPIVALRRVKDETAKPINRSTPF